jgi:ABC-2 type transport system ATP-binding protein
MSDSVIQLEALGRQFGSTHALADVSLSVARGTVMALLGPNGSGKTTLLKLVRGLIQPTTGRAMLLGQDSRSLTNVVTSRVACLFEGYVPPRTATVRQLFDLQAGASPKFDRAMAERWCEKRELPLHRRMWSFSKGQQRWVLLGLAFASRAEVLLLDEPADGLDPSARRELYDAIRDHANEHNVTAVVSTHVIGDIERVADELLLLRKGRIDLQAGLEELREQVCEVETSMSHPERTWSSDLILLGQREASGSRLTWLRAREGECQTLVQKQLTNGDLVRPVNLETLYLALTEYRAG